MLRWGQDYKQDQGRQGIKLVHLKLTIMYCSVDVLLNC